jgi:hypothetical protein
MQSRETAFDKIYKNYLEQLRELSFEAVAHKLGGKAEGHRIKIPFFTQEYEISAEQIADPSGNKPPHEVCVILSKYLLLCPDTRPTGHNWVSFRDFKDSGPLIDYFEHEVERAISTYFSGRLSDLKKASHTLDGYYPELDVQYDYAVQFDALPMIPVIMLFNDADEEFSAKCSVLFESRAEHYLDMECIAMLGRQLFVHLKRAPKRQ